MHRDICALSVERWDDRLYNAKPNGITPF